MAGRHFAKLCDLEDFADPELAGLIGDIDPSGSAERPHRKSWEYAMTALFLAEHGHLGEPAQILDVGAGSEPILFWLARRCGRVVAVDIYGQGGFGEREAQRSMLEDPAGLAPYEYPRERLEVHDMDARELSFADESFDAVISISSIEHFGGPAGISLAAAEIGRVLRPGGHAFLVTELLLSLSFLHRAPVAAAARALSLGRRAPQATLRRRPIDGFTAAELEAQIVRPSGLRLMEELDLRQSPETLENLQVMQPDGSAMSASGRPFPHLVVGSGRTSWTSVCLPLVKPR